MASRMVFAVSSGGPSSPLCSRKLQAMKNALSTVQRMDMRCQRGVVAAVPRGDVPSARGLDSRYFSEVLIEPNFNFNDEPRLSTTAMIASSDAGCDQAVL